MLRSRGEIGRAASTPQQRNYKGFRTTFFHDKSMNCNLKTADLPSYLDLDTENERNWGGTKGTTFIRFIRDH